MNDDNVIQFPQKSEKEQKEDKIVLNNAAECPNCGHKLFYIFTDGVLCYKCKTICNLQ